MDRLAPVRVGACWTLAGVLAWAAVAKLRDPAAFVHDLAGYQLFPVALLGAMAVAVPWIELAAALGLVVCPLRRGGLALSGGLLGVFAVVLGITWARGLDVRCGCFGGHGADTTVALALARDAGLAVLWALGACIGPSSVSGAKSQSARPRS